MLGCQPDKHGSNYQHEVRADVRYLEDKWIQFLRERGHGPPDPLPLEIDELDTLLDEYIEDVHAKALRRIRADAISQFLDEMRRSRAGAQKAISRIKKLLSIFRLSSFTGRLHQLLGRCIVSIVPPTKGDPIDLRVRESSALLHDNWGNYFNWSKGIISVHREDTSSIIHLGLGNIGNIFISIPSNLEADRK